MKILVFAHRLDLGGTQTNAVELAATVRYRHGHDVALMATPGPVTTLVTDHHLRYVPLPDPRRHPSPRIAATVASLVRRERPDLLHVWDWPQCFDAYLAHVVHKTPMLCTVMSMTVPGFLPRSLPTTFGTAQLVRAASRVRSGAVDLLEPPVDMVANAAGVVDAGPFVADHALDPDAVRLVIVSRLVSWLKLEGIARTIEAMRGFAPGAVQLVIVGEGDARPEVERHADDVNRALGWRTVVLTGPLVDPRPAYEAADIVIGMGSSALRAAATGRSLVVIGEEGFSEVLEPASADHFLWQGWYGIGDGNRSAERLREQLRALIVDQDRRRELGAFGRRLVEDRFGLDAAADRIDDLYRTVVDTAVSRRILVGEALRTTGWRVGSRVLPTAARRWLAPLKHDCADA